MITQVADNPQAIAKSSDFKQNKLFSSTRENLEFWLETAQKRETMPASEYSEHLKSLGWSNRNTSSYIKLAEFIKENLLDRIEAIATLDIRTLLKFPRPRYATIVEALKAETLTQEEVSKRIKQLPVKPREKKYKSVEEKKDEVIGFNIPSATNDILDRLEKLTGLSKQRLTQEAFELLLEKMEVDAPATDVDAQVVAQSELDNHIAQQADIIAPEVAKPVEAQILKSYDLELGDAVQWQDGDEIYAAYLNLVQDGNALLDTGNGVFSVSLERLKKIELDAIALEISDRKKLSYPYSQLYINAVNAKQEWVNLQTLDSSDEIYDWQLQQLNRWLSCAEAGANRQGIWFDLNELAENQRLVVVPGGEDLIKDLSNTPRAKRRTIKGSFLDAFDSGVPDVPSLEQRLKDADDWDEVAALVGRNNRILSQAISMWTIEDKQLLAGKLVDFLQNSFECAIHNNEISWLHQSSLASGLAKLELEVDGQACKFIKFVDYGKPDERWTLRTDKGETIIASRQEIKISVKF